MLTIKHFILVVIAKILSRCLYFNNFDFMPMNNNEYGCHFIKNIAILMIELLNNYFYIITRLNVV